jgi:hypothetical protein
MFILEKRKTGYQIMICADFGLKEEALFINPKNHRYYRLLSGIDLLGDFILMKTWGSLKSNSGNFSQEKIDQSFLPEKISTISAIRKKHKYDKIK